MISIGIKELLDSGVHFGHQTKRWNPKMKPFIFDARNGISHIIGTSARPLTQLETACDFCTASLPREAAFFSWARRNQAQEAVKESAKSLRPALRHRALAWHHIDKLQYRQTLHRASQNNRELGSRRQH